VQHESPSLPPQTPPLNLVPQSQYAASFKPASETNSASSSSAELLTPRREGATPVHQNERDPQPYAVIYPSQVTDTDTPSSSRSTILSEETANANSASPGKRYVTLSPKGSRNIIRDCPYPDEIKFSTKWHYLRNVPKFQVCSYCFTQHIEGTDVAVSFDSEMSLQGEARNCKFQIPRVQQLWTTSKRSKDFEALKALLEHRAGVLPCYGESGTTSAAGVKWFSPISGDIPGFVVCEACYEDYILASTFVNQFEVYKEKQTSNAIWACDLSLRSIERALKHCSEENDWRKFTSFASKRLKLPKCVSYEWLPTESVKWYQPKSLDYILCETCYIDSTAFSPFDKYFEPRPNELLKGRKDWLCLQGWITMKLAWEEAYQRRGYNHWFEQAQIMGSNLLCTASPVNHEKWFVLANHVQNFQICPSCYGVLIMSYGYAPYFKEQNHPGGAEKICSFFPTVRHANRFLEKLSEVIFVNDFSLLQNEIETWTNVHPCPRSEGVVGRTFYGSDDFLICKECYENAVKGTVLESQFTYSNTIFTKANKCDLYSPRMRALWAEACTKNDYDGFILICRQRQEIYLQTIPVIKAILTQQRIRLSRQKMLNASSNFYNFLNSTTAPSSQINYTGYSQPTYSYGAAGVGYGFETQFGVEGARLGQQASNLAFEGGGDIARAKYLEEVWKAVE